MMTEKEEAKHILALMNGDYSRSLDLLEKQLNVLQTRSQVLLSLAGVVITVTGFSGRIIADTNLYAQILIISGLLTVLVSAVFINLKVMHIKWLTTFNYETEEINLEAIIKRRNKKTNAFGIGSKILLAGIFLYCMAISVMLLFPHPITIVPR